MTDYICNQRHLTLSDRVYIEQALLQECSFTNIAKVLHKDPSTISKEIRNNRCFLHGEQSARRCRCCMNRSHCKEKNVCGNEHCHYSCRLCGKVDPTEHCMYFLPWSCNRSTKPPYVCNACQYINTCILEGYRYSASKAQMKYEKRLKDSRAGINMTPEELQELNNLISPLIIKGQPLSHIFAVHADEIPVSRRTLYNYLDQRVFQARNIDLPRRVRYKKRQKAHIKNENLFNQTYRNRRTYIDFERFLEAHPNVDVVEMDTVKGRVSSGKCLLTLLFRSCSFMLIILLPKCTQECVINAIDGLTKTLGLHCFRKHFPVILTDNGSEFKNPHGIEKTKDGKHRTYVFYCDPYVSNQKARLEKNHEYIRYFIPKGNSMQRFSQEDINLMASHINSTARDGLNGASPFDLADLLLDKKIPLLTGLKKVSPDEVMLKPALFEKRSE
ncbi:MAG: IS30 family transposase [Lachnospiraceae bacterium]|nr:IS30 family transposase [Lachnospiraceae bacterium]